MCAQKVIVFLAAYQLITIVYTRLTTVCTLSNPLDVKQSIPINSFAWQPNFKAWTRETEGQGTR